MSAAMDAPAVALGRRTWPQRLLITFNCFLIAGCVAAAGTLGYYYYQFEQIPTISFDNGILAPAPEDPGDPKNFLLVGSDSRDFAAGNEQDTDSFGSTADVGPARADTIILVRVDPRAETAAMLSFPRDLWLPIAGTGRENRINTAFEDGPQQLVQTITDNFQIPIDHYVQVGFDGFRGVVQAAGGVPIYLSTPVRDRVSGLDVQQTGCVTLNGDQALAYVRSRHFQQFIDGRWRTDPTGDINRINRQQDFVRRAVREAISRDLLNPGRLNDLIAVAQENVTFDSRLDLDDIRSLGTRFQSLAPGALQQFSLATFAEPTTIRSTGAQVLVMNDDPALQTILDVFRGIAPNSPVDVSPASVSVRVLNGSGVAGQASESTADLVQAGFSASEPGNAQRAAVTTILYGAGQEAKAQLLARYLEAGAQLRQDDLEAVDVVLVTGEDYTGVLATPRAPDATVPTTTSTSSTSTTAPPSPEDVLAGQC